MTATNARAQQTERMGTAPGFIAALDQSGGSTPKALKAYGVEPEVYGDDQDKMFDLVHEMRTRIITSPSFTSDHILAAILFEMTMDRKIEGIPTGDYLWEKKGIVPFLKTDKGLLLHRAVEDKHIFGTKERSVILDDDKAGIEKIVDQQFELAEQVRAAGLVPILEPEVDIHALHKEKAEERLHNLIRAHIDSLPLDAKIMLKLTIPSSEDLYADLIADPKVLRVVALSGGYSREEANKKLARNRGLIASFSRALAEGLNVAQSQQEFDQTLRASIDSIYAASVS